MLRLLSVICICVNYVNSYSFSVNNVTVISHVAVNNTYFAYSLLLQKGNPPVVIVGAPKKSLGTDGGAVYKCVLDGRNACTKFIFNMKSKKTPVGDFLGSAIDGQGYSGGSFTACSPLHVVEYNTHHYNKGLCIYSGSSQYMKLLNPFERERETDCCESPGRRYYHSYGFAMAGFDISYLQDKNEVLMGAPGVMKFSGATVLYSLTGNGQSTLPLRTEPDAIDDDTYLGYKVATGRFESSRRKIWYIAGAPRQRNLKGQVMIYEYAVSSVDNIKVTATIQGDEIGSYFGSTLLAVDVTNDNIDDMLIGAPMAAGKTWDEGVVKFYKVYSTTTFSSPVLLTGSSKSGSRFGSSMVYLGDFDLDSFNDVAISAPYEDDGVGAVYIYRGSADGLQNVYSQRLSPLEFNNKPQGMKYVRGFGMGLSRAADIDGNGHNDFVVGAYKSDQLFLITSLSIIDCQLSLNATSPTINAGTNEFDVTYCVYYSQRSKSKDITQVSFDMSLELDYRTNGETRITNKEVVKLQKTSCKTHKVQLKTTIKDISPYQVIFKVISSKNIVTRGKQTANMQIAYSHGCGDDNKCDTGLALTLNTNSSEIIHTLDKKLNIDVFVSNQGEPAYQCELVIELQLNVELISLKDCYRENRTYTCLLDERLVTTKQKQLVLDVSSISPSTTSLQVVVSVKSLGVNKAGYKNKDAVKIPVMLRNSPYIVGASDSERVEVSLDEDTSNNVEIIHKFSVGNLGPSPFKLDVNIFLPRVTVDDSDIFNILNVKGSLKGVEIACIANTGKAKEISYVMDLNKFLNVPANRSIIVTCSDEDCVEYSCKGEYLFKTSEVAVYEVTIAVDTSLLASKYKDQLTTKEIIAYVPAAYIKNSTDTINAYSKSIIVTERQIYIAWWIYVVSITAGFMLLAGLVFILYRCHFFDRNYQDKLNQEKILDSDYGEPISKDNVTGEEIFEELDIKS